MHMLTQLSANMDAQFQKTQQQTAAFQESISTEVKSLKGRVDEHDSAITTCTEEVAQCRIEQRALQIKFGELEKIGAQAAASAASGSSQKQFVPPWASTPRDQRNVFVCSSLGYNTDAKTLITRVRTVLTTAKATDPSIVDPVEIRAPFAFGSTVEIKYSDAAIGQKVAKVVKELQHKFDECMGRCVWMGPIATKEERKPGQQWGKVLGVFNKRFGTENIIVCDRTKQIYEGNAADRVLGKLFGGTWTWAAHGEQYRGELQPLVDSALA